MGKKSIHMELLDQEWMKLILTAKKMGIKKEEIKDYLLKHGVKELTLKVAE